MGLPVEIRWHGLYNSNRHRPLLREYKELQAVLLTMERVLLQSPKGLPFSHNLFGSLGYYRTIQHYHHPLSHKTTFPYMHNV